MFNNSKAILVRPENKIKESWQAKVFYVFLIIMMIGVIVVCLYPYLTVIALAFNDGLDAQRGGITIFPRKFTLDNFNIVFSDNNTLRAAWVSVRAVVLGTVLSVLFSYAAAYALSRKTLMGRNKIIMFYLIPGFIGGGIIPVYVLYSWLGLLNNFWVYIVPGCFAFYDMILMKAFINTIPTSLEEAARIDGANEFYIMFKIMIPLSLPIIATVTLWQIVGRWNDWGTCLYFIYSQSLYNLQFLLWQYMQESDQIAELMKRGEYIGTPNITPETIKAAQVVITTFPILSIYPFLQKYFVKGVLIGSVKE